MSFENHRTFTKIFSSMYLNILDLRNQWSIFPDYRPMPRRQTLQPTYLFSQILLYCRGALMVKRITVMVENFGIIVKSIY